MRRVPGWAVVSAGLAPILLIGGWTLAATRQPAGFDSIRDTISALAGLGATDRAVMTIGLAGLGSCHMVTAFGLRPARASGRTVLLIGGAATIAVSVFPLPRVGSSTAHGVFAAVALSALALWPAVAWRREQSATALIRPADAAWGLRPAVSLAASAILLILFGIFISQLFGHGHQVGLTERLLAGAESVWPLVVVLTARKP